MRCRTICALLNPVLCCTVCAHQERCGMSTGISTAAGIPDFRTPGNGLYDSLQVTACVRAARPQSLACAPPTPLR